LFAEIFAVADRERKRIFIFQLLEPIMMASDVTETGILSDEQIEQLIQEAEERARTKAAGAVARPDSEDLLTLQDGTPDFAKRKPIPKLKHGLERQSYIQENQGVAQVKRELLATKEQQTLADQPRKVEVKARAKKEVGHSFPSEKP
jgi:hypothetical protein